MIHRPSKETRVSDCYADIIEAVTLVGRYIQGMSIEQFMADTLEANKTRDSVIKNLIDIGEAANNIMQLDPGVEERDSELWTRLRGAYDMRIKLTHGYRSVNERIVWNTAVDYLPAFSTLIRAREEGL